MQLQLLGPPKCDQLLPLEKPFSLLYYLAYQGDWVSRDSLAFLYRPDATREVAQAHLRKLIHRVKDVHWASDLEIERSRLRFCINTDTKAFKSAIQQEDYARAIELYNAELLQGLVVSDAIAYSEWLELERESLFRLWREAILKESTRLLEKNPLATSDYVEKLIQRDFLDEEALQLYLQALFALGERSEALKVYERFAESLRSELDIEPLASTQAIIQAFHETRPLVNTGPFLPHASTAFIGRQNDLDLILERLSQADCRLLTLTGSGGIGKTRLALEVAHQRTLVQSVFFIELASTRSVLSFAASVAEGMGISLTGQVEALELIKRHIGTKDVLLVLDMFEHLLEAKKDVLELLKACPKLKILLSSRERLQLEAEWLMPLEGLTYPDEFRDLSLELASDFDAIALFLQTARQNQINTVFSKADVPALVTIAKSVDGSPLGLQLAASWLRAMPLIDIAEKLSQNLELLKNDNLQSIFVNSWKYLTEDEQALLIKLSVFQAGISYQAALTISGASLKVLTRLLDKSMLHLSSEGRYDFHPLIRSYVAEEAKKEVALFEDISTKHGHYFMDMLAETGELLHQHEQMQALEILERDLANIRAAWAWCIEHKNIQKMFTACEQLYWFFTLQGRFEEALEMIQDALPAYSSEVFEERGVKGRLLMAEASCLGRINSSDEAVHIGAESIKVLDASNDDLGKMASRITLSAILWRKGDYEAAHDRIQEAKKRHNSSFAKRWMGQLLGMQALIEAGLGKRVRAMISFQRALNINKQIGNRMQSVVALFGVGSALLDAGKLRQADSMLSQALSLAESIEYQAFEAVIMTNLAQLKLSRRAYRQTQELAKRILEAASFSGDQVAEADALILLGRAAIAEQKVSEGKSYLAQGLALAKQLENKLATVRALLGFAEHHMRQKENQEAGGILSSILPEAATLEKARAEALLMNLPTGTELGEAQDLMSLSENLLADMITEANPLTDFQIENP